MKFKIKGDYIALNQLMKAADWVSSGSEAHIFIENGEVLVNGVVELQKRKKIKPGDRVVFRGLELELE